MHGQVDQLENVPGDDPLTDAEADPKQAGPRRGERARNRLGAPCRQHRLQGTASNAVEPRSRDRPPSARPSGGAGSRCPRRASAARRTARRAWPPACASRNGLWYGSASTNVISSIDEGHSRRSRRARPSGRRCPASPGGGPPDGRRGVVGERDPRVPVPLGEPRELGDERRREHRRLPRGIADRVLDHDLHSGPPDAAVLTLRPVARRLSLTGSRPLCRSAR